MVTCLPCTCFNRSGHVSGDIIDDFEIQCFCRRQAYRFIHSPFRPFCIAVRASVQAREYTLRHHVLFCGTLHLFADPFSSFDNFLPFSSDGVSVGRGADFGLVSGSGSNSGGPPIWIGVAAPRFVPGAIAAMWLAYRIYVPALAARAPLGATKTATGTGEARMARMICRIEVSSPPGVSSCNTTRGVPSTAACCIPRSMKSALAGAIGPLAVSTTTGAAPTHTGRRSIAAKPFRKKPVDLFHISNIDVFSLHCGRSKRGLSLLQSGLF